MDTDLSQRSLQAAFGKEVDFPALLVRASAATETRYVPSQYPEAKLAADSVHDGRIWNVLVPLSYLVGQGLQKKLALSSDHTDC